jgi:hypothetical protein
MSSFLERKKKNMLSFRPQCPLSRPSKTNLKTKKIKKNHVKLPSAMPIIPPKQNKFERKNVHRQRPNLKQKKTSR